jgi:hypothetical protein
MAPATSATRPAKKRVHKLSAANGTARRYITVRITAVTPVIPNPTLIKLMALPLSVLSRRR